MNGKLYLHIGPPKTATTALQYVFQKGIPGKLFYGGVTQPRSEQVEISGKLRALCETEGEMPASAIQLLQDSIGTILTSGTTLLISEEMFLVDSGRISHQAKLARLSRILGLFGPVIILCARNPVEALPSLYQELYPGLSLVQKISFKRFLQGNQAKVFNYSWLLQELHKNGFQNVRILSFDRLVAGELAYTDVLGEDFPLKQRLSIQKTNSGRYLASQQTRREFEPYVIRDLIDLRHILPRRLCRFFLKKRRIASCFGWLATLPLTGKKTVLLELPDVIKQKLLSGYAFALSQAETSGHGGKNEI